MSDGENAAMCVLVLQGGGALGSYQAGVFEALTEVDMCPDWVAGISIGAINAALIAGNPVEKRVARLTEFWDLVTSGVTADAPMLGDGIRKQWNQIAAAMTVAQGAPGFFKPIWPPVVPWLKGPIGYYDTAPLRATLERLVDWDLLNDGPVRVSVGTVNVETGNFRYFDNREQRLGPEHIMASGALPPGFPPVLIDGEYWWDGGLVSNTPLDHVLEVEQERDLMIFQVDLFPSRGPMPETIGEAEERVKDIRFSSRTRQNTDSNVRMLRARTAFKGLVAKLPPELRDSEEVRVLSEIARENRITIAQLIYRDKSWAGEAKDYEFSRATMAEHWLHGREDVMRTVHDAAWMAQPMQQGTVVYDLTRPDASIPQLTRQVKS
ncbi:patatin-like phospholipase family protein [Sandarakinorhabdus sp. DWP1-3-1]|uniref:patatin-like phospholipase family protein n=1 Tax=Sandarakinorhabdus sp. DWP1-3-1 TaxID=2804627 RepID=UPI003CF81D21